MAYTEVHSVKNTFEKSLKYIKNPDKTTFIGSKNDLKDAMTYIKNPAKTKEFVFVEGYMCDPTFCESQFIDTKEKYLNAHGGHERSNTGTPAQAWHLIQSFPPDCKDPVLVHQMGMELAEAVCGKDFQAVVSTHVEGSHCMHNHIIFNAYPLDSEYGKKYNRSISEYNRIKKCSDEIGLKYGIEPIISNDEKENASIGIGELNAKQKGQSWKQKVKDDIEKACNASSDWDTFKKILTARGYKLEEHDGYVKYETPYSKKAVRDRTLGEVFTKAFLEAQWDPEAKKAYEEKKAEEARKQKENTPATDRKKYDAEERARWREAQILAAKTSKPGNGMRDDPAYKVARYDAAGNRRSNVQMLILVAVKIIRVDKNVFEDQFGTYRFPTSPIYAPRDWKLQQMMNTATLANQMGIREVSDIEKRRDELNEKLSKVATDIRKKKAYLGRIGSLNTAIEQWEATRDTIEQLNKLPSEEKDQFEKDHSKEIEAYNKAVSVFYKFSGRYATTPIMVYDPDAHKKIVSHENIASILDSVEKTKDEIEKLQTQRKQIASDIAKVRRISTGLALAQNDLFCHGPKYTPEKLAEIRARAAEQEAKAMEQYDKVKEIKQDEFESYVDDMLNGTIEEKDGFVPKSKGGKDYER